MGRVDGAGFDPKSQIQAPPQETRGKLGANRVTVKQQSPPLSAAAKLRNKPANRGRVEKALAKHAVTKELSNPPQKRTAAKTQKHTPPDKPLPPPPFKKPGRPPPKAPGLPPVPPRPGSTAAKTQKHTPPDKPLPPTPFKKPGRPPPKAPGLPSVPPRPRKISGKVLPSQFTKNLRPPSKAGPKAPVFVPGKPGEKSPAGKSQFTPPPAVRPSKPETKESKPLNKAQENLEQILVRLEKGKKGKVTQKDLQNAFKEIAKLKDNETFFEITNNDGKKVKVNVHDIALKLAEHPKAGKALKNKGVRKSLETYVSKHQNFSTGEKLEELKNLKKPKQLQNFITNFSNHAKEAEQNKELLKQQMRRSQP